MKTKLINDTKVSDGELNLYRERISKYKLNRYAYTAIDVGMDKRIITVNVNEEITFINPRIVEQSEKPIIYFEEDGKRYRRTIRYQKIKVESDNLEPVEFASAKTRWDDYQDMMNDIGLVECVLVQRAINAIDGIDINHPSVKFNPQVINDRSYNRNEKVMIQSDSGETLFVKYKKAKPLLDSGQYKLV